MLDLPLWVQAIQWVVWLVVAGRALKSAFLTKE